MPGQDREERRLFVWLAGALVVALASLGGIVLARSGTDDTDPVPLEVLAAQIETTTTTRPADTTTSFTTTTAAPTTTAATTTTATTTPSSTTTTPAPTTTRPPATTTTVTVVIIPPITIETTTTSRVPVEPPAPPPPTTTTTVPETTTTVPETTTTTTTTTTPTTTTLAPGMYVHDLRADETRLEEPLWIAEVRVEVRNEEGARVAGAEVVARWSNGQTAPASGTTDSAGRVTLTLQTVAPTVTFTVVGVTHPDYTYRPDRNRETSITVSTPY